MKQSKILDFIIIYISLSTLKISSKSESWSPKLVRFSRERPIYSIFVVDEGVKDCEESMSKREVDWRAEN